MTAVEPWSLRHFQAYREVVLWFGWSPGSRTLDLLLGHLRTRREGLSEREAARRLEQHGPNGIQRRQGTTRLAEFAAAIIYLPPLQEVFGTNALGVPELALLAVFSLVVWGTDELWRWVRRGLDAG